MTNPDGSVACPRAGDMVWTLTRERRPERVELCCTDGGWCRVWGADLSLTDVEAVYPTEEAALAALVGVLEEDLQVARARLARLVPA